MQMMTEYEFTLPVGYEDKEGTLHRSGVMRLATAADEILPMRDPRVRQNPSYVTIMILSRVITRLGNITDITTDLIENLYAKDMEFLNDMYQMLNGLEEHTVSTVCPECGVEFQAPLNFTGKA